VQISPPSTSLGLANRKQYKREIETSSQIGTATKRRLNGLAERKGRESFVYKEMAV